PYYGRQVLKENPLIYTNVLLNLSCQPCSKYGTHTCPLEHFNCMNKQDVDAITLLAHQKLFSI
ncbi:MAG: hypothetical protein ABIO05_08770, partial [Ferruginibacter sp.]